MLCYFMLRCYGMLCYVTSCYVVMLCHVMLCYVMSCYVMLMSCYVMLCCVMLSYVMLQLRNSSYNIILKNKYTPYVDSAQNTSPPPKKLENSGIALALFVLKYDMLFSPQAKTTPQVSVKTLSAINVVKFSHIIVIRRADCIDILKTNM